MAKLSKNLKEAKERMKRALKNKNHKEIAMASVEILIYDKKRSDALTRKLIRGLRKLKKEQEKNKKG